MPAQTQYQIYPEAELDARPRYFDGQFLRSQDFVDEQRYHIDRLRREIRGLHVAGVVSGLAVTSDAPLKLTVSPGTAVDVGGRQIVLITQAVVSLASDLPRPASYILVVRYTERGDASLGGRDDEPGTRGFTRFREEPQFQVLPADNPVPSDAVGLAQLALDGGGTVTVSTPAVLRRYSGLRLPGPDGNGPTLTTGGDPAPRRIDLSGDLRITGQMTIDNGVIQRGGEPITATKDLGLYSQVDGNWLRFVTKGGRHSFFNDGGIGSTPDLVVEPNKTTIRGALAVTDIVAGGLVRAGDVDWGPSNSRTQGRDNAGLQGNAGARSGFFDTSAASPANNYPPGSSSWWHLLDVRHYNPGNNYALQLSGSFYDQRLWFRKVNNDPATAWRRVLTTDDLGVTLDGKVGIGVGLLGTSAAPRANLDVAQSTRSGAHPGGVKGLYVTGDFGQVADGPEFRHSDGTQGVGLGYSGVYAAGTLANQSLYLVPRGNGGVGIGASAFGPAGKLEVRLDPGALAGWDRFVVVGTKLWNGSDTHVTIGAGGAAGIVVANPHVGWLAAEKRASIRYAHVDADATKTWWDVGNREDGAFTFVASGAQVLRVDAAAGATFSGALRAASLQVNPPGSVTPRAKLEVTSGAGDWVFLRQSRDVGGGGGFVLHNPWDVANTAGGADDRNRLEFAYQAASGAMRWGLLVLQSTGNVGINVGVPKAMLHVNGRMFLDNGVIQRGGDAITATSELGLYSQVDGSSVRFVSKSGKHLFFNDGGVGATADLTVEASKTTVRGVLQANRFTADNSLTLNDFQTVNPSSNVFLASPGGDRDAWIYRDTADAVSNWGIYHRQIDTAVKGLPGNSIGFVGGGDSTLKAFINLSTGHFWARGIGVNLPADTAPKTALHVNGRVMVDNGVIQRGGDALTSTNDLGLYSQVEGNYVRYVSMNGRHVFFNDGGVGTSPDLVIQKGELTANGNLKVYDADSFHLQLIRPTTTAAGGAKIFLELLQSDTVPASTPQVNPSIRFHHANRFWSRIEGSPDGFFFRTGDPNSNSLAHASAADINSNGRAVPTGNAERLRIVRGTVNASAVVEAGAGFTVTKTSTGGMYRIAFSPAFDGVPTVVATQQYPDSNDNGANAGGNTKDNAVIVSVAKDLAYIKTGNGDGDGTWRRFHFIAMGT